MKNTNMIWKWLVLAILATFSIYVVLTPPGAAKRETAAEDAEDGAQSFLQKHLPGIRLGIDLAGGTSFTVEVDREKLLGDIRDEITAEHPSLEAAQVDAQVDAKYRERTAGAEDRVLEVLRKRVDGMGVNEPIIFKGKERIVIQLPGANAEQRAMAERSIESAAFLEFRLVHKDNDRHAADLLAGNKPAPKGFEKHENGRGYARTQDYAQLYNNPDPAVRAENLRSLARFGCERIPNHSMMLMESDREAGGKACYIPTFVSNKRELTGAELQSASIGQDGTTGEMHVNLRFNANGARIFRLVTLKHRPNGTENPSPDGRRLAIVLDGVLYSAPSIQTEIPDGRAVITGRFSINEAHHLANTLNAGALPTPVRVIEKRVIDPTLGRDAINSGLYAAAGGGLLVFLFMLVYYFYCGFVANIALALDLLLLPAGMILAAGCLSFFDRSVDSRFLALPVFTMPGIAGIVLTIGMAVDANVLIFERIREEFKLGKSARAAVDAGYDRAFLAILDSNLTTLLSAVILFIIGTGPVKGFAITLSAGIIISMFTVLVVTRMVFDLTVPEGRVKPYKMLSMVRGDMAFDFLGKARPAILASAVAIAATLLLFGYRAATSPAVLFSVDLTGGTTIEFTYNQRVSAPEITAALKAAGVLDAEVQYQGTLESDRVMQVRTSVQAADNTGDPLFERVQSALDGAFPDAQFKQKASDTIGASVGREMRNSAMWAVIAALIGMILYITLRFEFGFAIGAITALAADVLMCVGLFSLMGRQISLTVVAALLTIVGYAINDTIVVFDRIREDLGRDPRADFKALVNRALNRTLSRTFLTSFTTLLPVLALVIFASGAIFDFALLMCIGIIFGTFGTLFIATPVMVAWYRGRRPGFEAAKRKI